MKKTTIFIALIFSFVLFIFLANKINLPASDIGRHVKNGEVFLKSSEYSISRSELLHTNFYSYTHKDFPFINHHWGYGILAYIFYSFSGWTGLSFFYISSLILAFLLLFILVSKKIPLYTTIPVSLFLIPLIAERKEIRPEGLSYLFVAIFIYILVKYLDNKIQKKYLYILPILTILWINTHIYAIFAPLLIGAFLCESLIKKDFEKSKKLTYFLILTSISLLVSPYGLEGALYPFKIFNNYGYLVAENQSIPFLENLNFINPNYLWWKISSVFLLIGSIFAFYLNRHKFPYALFFISTAFAGLSYFGTRHLTLYGLILLPTLCSIINIFTEKIDTAEKRQNAWSWSIITTIFLTIFICFQFNSRLPWNTNFGLGLLPHNIDSVSFIKKTNIQGPFFSNYDIGGLFIFSLFNQERKELTFVDNRPESYPKEFFSSTYIPMQNDINIWKDTADKYNFNAVWFYRLDNTPWAQNYLISMIQNKEWSPVYVDDFTIIFLKRNERNNGTINQFELPQSMFSIN